MAESENPPPQPPGNAPGNGDAGATRPKRLDNPAIEALLGAARSGSRPGGSTWRLPEVEELQREFSQFEILELLGRGGMGAVYKGWQKSLDRFVALKILPPEVEDLDPHFIERFRHEAKAMAGLSHPAICPVYDAGETPGGLLYFVMEYIEGGDLGQKIVAQGRFAPEEALALARTLCDALQAAHERGIVHRDIKPSNILHAPNGQWKVADFGLAKLAGQPNEHLTFSDTSMGSLGFASPEALSDGASVDHRTDIYAAGVILYQMLTGTIPRGAFEMPAKLVPGLDPRFDAIVAKAMQPDRERRFASAAEMRGALDGIATDSSVASRHELSAGPKQPSFARWALGAAGLVIFIGGGWSIWQRQKPALPAVGTGTDPDSGTTQAFITNTLGMKFVPVPIIGGPTGGQRVLFSIWETRVQDFRAFVTETKRAWPPPSFEQGPAHPAVNVTWDDAQAFCVWLTERERKAGRLGANERYRLPTDREWSCAAGLGEREDPAQSLEEKSQQLRDLFAWGEAWPPPQGFGNYSGEEAVGNESWNGQSIITGYRDKFPKTAPVGSFPQNSFGLFDLSGNAWEWCEDRFSPSQPSRVMRGASFDNGGRGGLFLSNRDRHTTDDRKENYGFRVVLAEATPGGLETRRPAWKPVPFKQNPKMDGGFVHLVKYDTWALPKLQLTNAAVRAVIVWQQEPEGKNDYIKVTARLRKNDHYYAHLTGPSVEVGYYQAPTVHPLHRWSVTPPPKPNEAIPLQLACVGSRLAVWVRGELVGTFQDPTLTEAGTVSVQAGDGHIQNLEFVNFDGVTEDVAVKFLGLDATP